MEEVICPHCGKTNLATDKFCHQCLKPLGAKNSSEGKDEYDTEEIPEWLKRIRELKRIDEEREKEKEKWRQQSLFGQSGEPQKPKGVPTEGKKSSPRTNQGKEEAGRKHSLPFQPAADTQLKSSPPSNNQPSAHSPNNSSDNLPDGFLPFEE